MGHVDYFFCQCKYAFEIVEESGLLGSKPLDFPMKENHKLAVAQGPLLDYPSQYRQLVGRLIYLTITRLELCYAIHVLSQVMQDPREEQMAAAHCILRYLKGTPGYGILLRSNYDMQVQAFCDADWGACPLTR